jgi:probable secreted protein
MDGGNSYMLKKSLVKVLMVFLSINQIYGTVPLRKFKPEDYQTDFIETPTRFIFINRDKCDEGLSCDDVAYYEINKKTGKVFKIARGETINVGPTQDFRGYYFTTKNRKFLYQILYQGESYLTIMDPKTYKEYSDEEIREY